MPLQWFYTLSGSYIVAMVLYALLIKIVLFPFGIKQQKGMIRQAKIRPKEMAIRKRYAGRDDRKTQLKLQEDLQKLYQEEGYNPLGGCGPMAVQLPIIYVLYRIVYKPLSYIMGLSADTVGELVNRLGEITGSKFAASNEIPLLEAIRNNFDKLTDVGGFADRFANAAEYEKFFEGFRIGGVDLTQTPNKAFDMIKSGGNWSIALVLIAIPVLVFVAQYASMKVIRKFSYQPVQDAQAAASMKIMDFTMPLMTLFMAFVFPGLLGIYWIINSLLSMVQQIILKKLFPAPVFTEEDYKAAEKQMNGKLKPAKKTAGKKKKNPNSLHHIDDDDDEDEPNGAPAQKPAKKKANPLIEPAQVKDKKDTTTESEGETNE